MEQGFQSAEGTLADLTSKVHAVEDGSAAVSRRLSEFNAMATQVQQLHQSLTQTDEKVREAERRLNEALRVQHQESERQRLELNDALRHLELLQRVVEGWGARFENVESTIGRVQEALTLTRQRTDEMDRRQENAEIHAARVAEALKRYEHLTGRLEVDIEGLQKGHVQAGDRIQAFSEAMKRIEEQSDAVAAEVTAQRDIFERMDLLRAELHRLEDRIAGAETQRDLDRQEIEDHQRVISLLDGKDRGFADRLAMLQGELAAYRELVGEQFNRLHLTLGAGLTSPAAVAGALQTGAHPSMTPGLTQSDRTMGVLKRYRDRLPITDATPMLTLGEGSTPLVQSRRLVDRVGCKELYFKLESCNPTGSFKDRGMVVAIAKAVEHGATAVLCASTGNTSASAAAYAAYMDLECYVVVPSGNIALGKLAQAVAFGAKILAIDGSFDAALTLARTATQRHKIALVNSVNPDRIEGQKTAAFEIVDDLGDAPDHLAIPVGNAGNITAYWRGFTEEWRLERATRRPVMLGFQAEGAAPIVVGHPIENPTTIASAIRIGNPASWSFATAARDESGGAIEAVSDDEILDAYHLLAREEGIFGEPASATPLAGLLKQSRSSRTFAGKTIVCVVTGSGLKDPDTAMKTEPQMYQLPADLNAIERTMGWV